VMRPSSPTRTAPSSSGGAVTGYTRPARTRSTPLGHHGVTPVPNGECTGQDCVGSVPG
jgi:hypothetical protein